jgi:hypothetical protein
VRDVEGLQGRARKRARNLRVRFTATRTSNPSGAGLLLHLPQQLAGAALGVWSATILTRDAGPRWGWGGLTDCYQVGKHVA